MRTFKLLSIILILFIIVIPGCKKDESFDLSGTWNITITVLGQDFQDTLTLSGSESSGTGRHTIYGEVGSYQIKGSDVTFSGQVQDDSDTIIISGSGVIIDENNMNGSFTFYNSDFPDFRMSGIWNAKKN